MQFKKNAAPGQTGRGAESIQGSSDSRSDLNESKGVFFLHVHPDGTEERFDSQPGHVPVLRVQRWDGIEQTATYNRRYTRDGYIEVRIGGSGRIRARTLVQNPFLTIVTPLKSF